MSTILESGRQLLDALSFANVSTLHELRTRLGRLECVPEPLPRNTTRDGTAVPQESAAVPHAPTPAQGVL